MQSFLTPQNILPTPIASSSIFPVHSLLFLPFSISPVFLFFAFPAVAEDCLLPNGVRAKPQTPAISAHSERIQRAQGIVFGIC